MKRRHVTALMLVISLVALSGCGGSSSTQNPGTGGTITGTAK